ncbi:hypothetical protein NBRC111894_4571 [Sporolactobacillus inulinus]|uniref:Uncharacterized protein n=1 Tax=Sporolactobacillus inulinus TaxID=2078 RepID=A0A4Y1ZIN8_9BACL|nr:hypothetical protein NBRC111894_4571 [Sporolactobacillus inulinus]
MMRCGHLDRGHKQGNRINGARKGLVPVPIGRRVITDF